METNEKRILKQLPAARSLWLMKYLMHLVSFVSTCLLGDMFLLSKAKLLGLKRARRSNQEAKSSVFSGKGWQAHAREPRRRMIYFFIHKRGNGRSSRELNRQATVYRLHSAHRATLTTLQNPSPSLCCLVETAQKCIMTEHRPPRHTVKTCFFFALCGMI